MSDLLDLLHGGVELAERARDGLDGYPLDEADHVGAVWDRDDEEPVAQVSLSRSEVGRRRTSCRGWRHFAAGEGSDA